MKRSKAKPKNRWWFKCYCEGARFADEILWSGAEARWRWWVEAMPLMHPDYQKFCWKDVEERAAYYYELARRASPASLSLPTYPELTAIEQEAVKNVFGISEARWAAFLEQRSDTVQLPVFWNLRESNESVCSLFKAMLDAERKERRIEMPKAPPSRRRPINWNCDLNLLDEKPAFTDGRGSYDAAPISISSAASLKSKAKKNSLELFKKLLPTIQERLPRLANLLN